MEDRIQYLLRQYENNKCTKEELEELFGYFRNSRNSIVPLKQAVKKIYDDIRKNHPSFTYVDENGRLMVVEPEAQNPARPIQDKQKSKMPLWVWLLTAAIITVAMVWVIRGRITQPSASRDFQSVVVNKVQSGNAQQKILTLPLGTEVWLNAASEIEFPAGISKDSLSVNLTGEAFFHWKDTTGVVLVIHTGPFSAVVSHGAQFNVKSYTGKKEITVSVDFGRVTIQKNQSAIATLGQHQRVSVDINEVKTLHQPIAAGEAGSWRQKIHR